MHVVSARASSADPARADAAHTMAEYLCGEPAAVAIVVGAVGMGKTAVLAGGVRRAAARLRARIIFVPGGMIASEGHLATLLSAEVAPALAGTTAIGAAEVLLRKLADDGPAILAVDDLDVLLFKRNALAKSLSAALVGTPLRLAASIGPHAIDRIAGLGRPLTASELRIRMIALSTLSAASARRLALRRNPTLPSAAVDRIVYLAGGHPAAVVFLSRLVAASTTPEGEIYPGERALNGAAEFAGSVYSGPWTSLGPQQRAIIGAIPRFEAPTGPTGLATFLALPPSHVSAQLTRLRAEGLVLQGGRGRFTVAPLLAQWLARRAEPAPRSTLEKSKILAGSHR